MRNVQHLAASIDLSFTAFREKLTFSTWLIIAAANLFTLLFERAYLSSHYDTLEVRLIVCLMILPLFTHGTQLFQFIRPYHKAYFLISAFLLLPFMFSLMLLLNQPTPFSRSYSSSIFLYEYFIASFIFTGLFSRLQIVALLQVFAYLLCLPLVLLLNPNGIANLLQITLGMVAVQATSLSYSLLTHRNMNFVAEEKIAAAYSIGASVAHEIRTPLLTIKNLAIASERSLRGQTEQKTKGSYDSITEHMKTIQSEVAHSNTVIDMLLLNTRSGNLQIADEPIVVSTLVKDAIERFPFNNRAEKSLMSIRELADFQLQGSHLLLLHAVMNLMKNSLAATASHGEKKIEIAYGISPNNSQAFLDVIDNGPGVDRQLENSIFQSFVTTSTAGVGSGIGLPFSRSVVYQMGGDLQYERIDSHTHFVMRFKKFDLIPQAARTHSSPH